MLDRKKKDEEPPKKPTAEDEIRERLLKQQELRERDEKRWGKRGKP